MKKLHRKIIIANWKMAVDISQCDSLIKRLAPAAAKYQQQLELIICPPFVYLEKCIAQGGINLSFGSQNMCWEARGAFTGEVAGFMLCDLGCKYVILGHSERRWFESDQLIAQKFNLAMDLGLIPVLCVGETWQQKEQQLTNEVIAQQLSQILPKIGENKGEFIIGYEPVWAIGKGQSMPAAAANDVALYIREKIGDRGLIVYGGSITPDNAADFAKQSEIDGVLVGSASLDAEKLMKICEINRCEV